MIDDKNPKKTAGNIRKGIGGRTYPDPPPPNHKPDSSGNATGTSGGDKPDSQSNQGGGTNRADRK